MNLTEEIENAKIINREKEIKSIENELCNKKKNDIDLFVQILNGKIYEESQEIFSNRKKIGYYDKMNVPTEYNL